MKANCLQLLLILLVSYFPFGILQRVNLHYPITFHQIDDKADISVNLRSQELTCFYSNQHPEKSYFQILLCFTSLLSSEVCTDLWGSRSVVLTVSGSVEFVKSSQIPVPVPESSYSTFNGSRWVEINSLDQKTPKKEIVQIPAEPVVLCGRSNHHSGQDSHIEISFRHPYVRERDMRKSFEKLFYHVLLLLVASSMWLLPYIVSVTVAIYSYIHGIKVILILLVCSFLIVSLFPIMLMKKNRELMKLYVSYFFSRKLAAETKQLVKKQKPLFQALYFSCILLHIGSISSYLMYHYFGIDRELRNNCLKVTIGLAISWFAFFVCRAFERFLSNWIWVVLAFGLAQMIEVHINPGCRNEVVLLCAAISLAESLLIHQIMRTAQMQFIGKEMARSIQAMSDWTISLRSKSHHHVHGGRSAVASGDDATESEREQGQD